MDNIDKAFEAKRGLRIPAPATPPVLYTGPQGPSTATGTKPGFFSPDQIKAAQAATNAKMAPLPGAAPPVAPAPVAAPAVAGAPKPAGMFARGLGAAASLPAAGALYAGAKAYEMGPAGIAQEANNQLRDRGMRVRMPDGSETPVSFPSAAPPEIAAIDSSRNAIAERANLRAPAIDAAAGGPAANFGSKTTPPAAAPAVTPAAAPVSVDAAQAQLRSGQEPGGGFTLRNGMGVYGRNNPNAGKAGESARQYVGVGAPEAPGASRSMMDNLYRPPAQTGGGAAPNSFSSDAKNINERYDKLADQLGGMYGSKGQGNLARRLLELEQARAGALDSDARIQQGLRGQNVDMANTASTLATQERNAQLSASSAAGLRQGAQATAEAKALADQQKALTDRGEKGVESFTKFVDSQFDTKTDVGRQEAAAFERYLYSTYPEYTNANADERRSFESEALNQFRGEAPIRERAAEFGAPISQGANLPNPTPTAITIDDVLSKRARASDLSWRNFVPGADLNQDALAVVDADGNPIIKIPEKEYLRRPDGSMDGDRMSRLRQQRNQ